jgi:hypothetical protein
MRFLRLFLLERRRHLSDWPGRLLPGERRDFLDYCAGPTPFGSDFGSHLHDALGTEPPLRWRRNFPIRVAGFFGFFLGGATSIMGPGRLYFFLGGATSMIGPGFFFLAMLILLVFRSGY